MAGSAYKVKVIDYPKAGKPMGEASHATFPGTTLTAANFDAQDTLMDNLRAAIVGVISGKINIESRVAVVEEVSATPVTDKDAQRERKWLCRYHDASTGERYTLTVPTADSAILATNSEEMDLDDAGAGLAFKTAFDAYVKVYVAGSLHSTLLDSATLVGRNL